MLNQTEKRRQRLLEYTRNLYTDKKTVPAIHPRYKAAYYQIYPESTSFSKNTLVLRIIVSIVLFAVFISMKQNGIELLGIDNLRVLETIVHNYQIRLY